MTIPTPLALAIERAKANKIKLAWTLMYEAYEVPFEFRFYTDLPPAAMELVGSFQGLMKDEDAAGMLHAITEFLDMMATPDTQDVIAELLGEKVLSFNDLVNIQARVMERVSARPTESSPSSGDGSPGTTPSSMPGVPSGESIPSPSPSTGS